MPKVVKMLVPGSQVDNSVPMVTGQEEVVDTLVAQKRAMDTAKAAFEAARASLRSLASVLRIDAEKHGNFQTKVQLQGSESCVGMSFSNRLTTMDAGSAAELRGLIGDTVFDAIFCTIETVRIRDDKVQDLRGALARAGLNFDEFVDTKVSVGAAEDFRRQRFESRRFLNELQNAALDNVIEQVEYEPTLSGMKWADKKSA